MAPTLAPIEILVVCTGNICRSPMAEALLRHRLARVGVQVEVRSAGTRAVGGPASVHGVDVLAADGIDLSSHESRSLDREEVRAADLVLAMAREHLRSAVVLRRDGLKRVFTLKELVRRGEATGGRKAGEPMEAWLDRVGLGRTSASLMGSDPRDDVADPIGRPRGDYERTYAELTDLVDRFVALAFPSGEAAE